MLPVNPLSAKLEMGDRLVLHNEATVVSRFMKRRR
jgi:hypothetical protein